MQAVVVAELGVSADAATVSFEVRDQGSGMRPRADSPGLGAGLRVSEHSCEALGIEPRPGGGTVLRMAFRR